VNNACHHESVSTEREKKHVAQNASRQRRSRRRHPMWENMIRFLQAVNACYPGIEELATSFHRTKRGQSPPRGGERPHRE